MNGLEPGADGGETMTGIPIKEPEGKYMIGKLMKGAKVRVYDEGKFEGIAELIEPDPHCADEAIGDSESWIVLLERIDGAQTRVTRIVGPGDIEAGEEASSIQDPIWRIRELMESLEDHVQAMGVPHPEEHVTCAFRDIRYILNELVKLVGADR